MTLKILRAKVCLVGEEGVGKTSLIRRCVLNMLDDLCTRTMGTKVSKKTVALAPRRGARARRDDDLGHHGRTRHADPAEGRVLSGDEWGRRRRGPDPPVDVRRVPRLDGGARARRGGPPPWGRREQVRPG